MNIVVPAIIPTSLLALRAEIDSLEGVATDFQVDIVDGMFVPFTSWPGSGGVPGDMDECVVGFSIELDLMVQDPEKTLADWVATSADRFVIHVESTEDVRACIVMVKAAGKKIGLSLNNDTELSVIEEYIDDIDFVQCMGISEIGRQGNSFDERVLARVKFLKEKYPDLEVSVDGSVNFDTIDRLKDVGVSRFISGSAVLHAESPKDAFVGLQERVR